MDKIDSFIEKRKALRNDMSIQFGFNLYRIQLRMIFGPKHRFRKEYDEALDALNERGNWLYLYDRLEGPNAEQVCEALKKWVEAHQVKKAFNSTLSGQDSLSQQEWDQVVSTEKELKRDLHVLIYGKDYAEGYDGYTSE
jgi:uncharacterized protein HemY